MYDKDSDYNYTSEDNGVVIASCTSEKGKCISKNILTSDTKVKK